MIDPPGEVKAATVGIAEDLTTLKNTGKTWMPARLKPSLAIERCRPLAPWMKGVALDRNGCGRKSCLPVRSRGQRETG